MSSVAGRYDLEGWAYFGVGCAMLDVLNLLYEISTSSMFTILETVPF